MSGGSYDYVYAKLLSECSGRMYDIEMNEFICDFANVLKSLEWWQSGDSSEDSYREKLKDFKNKWFCDSRDKRLKDYIDKKLIDTKIELYQLIGYEEKK